jgi:hypothetical protein
MKRVAFATSLLVCLLGAAPTSQPASPFAFVDVCIDSHGVPLAAYQFELRVASGDVKLVGIEGGDHAAFAKPPYYDPKALLNDRVVIAAFNTGSAETLPSQKTRVARLMVRVGGEARPKYEVKLHVAASVDAKPVADAQVATSEGAAR